MHQRWAAWVDAQYGDTFFLDTFCIRQFDGGLQVHVGLRDRAREAVLGGSSINLNAHSQPRIQPVVANSSNRWMWDAQSLLG